MESISRGDNILVVVAGPSCAGKTTFLNRLRLEGPTLLPDQIKHIPVHKLTVCNAMHISVPISDCAEAGTILHYDLFRPITFYQASGFSSDPVLDVLDTTSSRYVITLWEDQATLLGRSRIRRRRLYRKLIRRPMIGRMRSNLSEYFGAWRRRELMRAWFEDSDRLDRLYEDWFRFCDAKGVADHWILRCSKNSQSYVRLNDGVRA